MRKKFFLIVLLLAVIFIASCAPKGVSEEKPAERDDFGCWPPSCSLIPDSQGKQMCEDWKAGKEIQWFDCSAMAAFPKCVKLCEFEKKETASASDGQKQGFDQNPSNQNQQQSQQQPTGIPDSDPEAGSVYIYISDQAEGCQDNCGANPITRVGNRSIPDSRIIRIDDLTGKNWVSLGTYGKGINQFRNPNHLTVGPDGKLYVVDSVNDRIVRIDDMTGKGWTAYGVSGRTGEPNTPSQKNLPPGEGLLAQPASVRFDSRGRIYIISGGELVRIDDFTGKGWTTFGSAGSGVNQFSQGKGLAIDSKDRIYIVDAGNHRIIRIDDMTGKGWTTYGAKGSGVGQFEDELNGLSFDAQERIYISDEHNHRIVRIDDMTGKGWVEFGSFGNGVGQFDQPHDIWIMKNGHIYILDTPNGRVVRIDDMTGKGWITFAPYATRGTEDMHEWTMQAPHGMFVVERE